MRKLTVLFVSSLVLAALPSWAEGSGRDLRQAALEGDLAKVRQLVEGGVGVDDADTWGNTALAYAAGKGHLEVARYLLENGADPNAEETFFGVSVLDQALGVMGELNLEMARLILGAGAEDRASALWVAFSRSNVELAEAALASGKILESELADLEERFPSLEGRLKEVLDQVETRPDPPPPTYDDQQLAAFTGDYEGGGQAVAIEMKEGRLAARQEGHETVPLKVVAERGFASEDGKVEVSFFGRAGMVEGFALHREGSEPVRMRVVEVAEVHPPKKLSEREEEPRQATVNWPGFRGENRSGIGDGRPTPVDWDLETGRGVLWRADLPGLGNSSPVVWGNRVFVTTAVAAGEQVPLRTGLTGEGTEIEENTEHRWLVLAFDKRQGKKLWETEVGRGIPLTKRHFKATQANSTPATDGEHLVVVFPTAGLACLGLGGELHWKVELGGLNAGGFNDPSLQWGYASSPVIVDDRVILPVDIHEGPYIAAWSLEDGRQLWRKERPDVAPSWSTPAIWETPMGREVVVNASTIHAYDPADGSELWSLGPNSVQVVASPVIGDGLAFLSSGYPPVKPIYAIEPGLRGDHEIAAGGPMAGLAWSHSRGGAYMPTPILYRGLYYVVHHNSRLVAYDAATGDAVFKARFSEPGTATNSPVANNGRIYQGTEEGRMFVLEAGPSYEEIAKHDFGEPLMATPAISEGILFVRTPGHLFALADAGEE